MSSLENNSPFSSGALRYRNPIICEHLASQYVTGVLTPRVRSRLEALLLTTPELNRAVAFWADQMADIQLQLPEHEPLKNLWNKIDQLTPTETASSKKGSLTTVSWWKNLLLWQTAGITGIATSFALALILFIAPLNNTNTTSAAPNYMAAMSAHNDESDTIRFVINAYKKTDTSPSRLFVQWSKRQPREHSESLFLWAEDKDTGKLTYIGNEPVKGEPWHLNKPTWQAISNSSRLLVTRNQQFPNQDNTVFSGPCIQLTDWKQKVI